MTLLSIISVYIYHGNALPFDFVLNLSMTKFYREDACNYTVDVIVFHSISLRSGSSFPLLA